VLGTLAAKYESNADPAAVAQDPGDAGGWSYGLYQFASAMGVVQEFISWLEKQPPPADGFGRQLAAAGDPTCDQTFVETWIQIAGADPDAFSRLQDDYARTLYFDPGAHNLLAWYNFDITSRSNALQQVLFANCIQHGTRYGSEVFGDAAAVVGRELSTMDDKDIIFNIYEVKLTDPAWSNGSPADRPALYARWESERTEALALLAD
jgi:hypothetical protein